MKGMVVRCLAHVLAALTGFTGAMLTFSAGLAWAVAGTCARAAPGTVRNSQDERPKRWPEFPPDHPPEWASFPIGPVPVDALRYAQ